MSTQHTNCGIQKLEFMKKIDTANRPRFKNMLTKKEQANLAAYNQRQADLVSEGVRNQRRRTVKTPEKIEAPKLLPHEVVLDCSHEEHEPIDLHMQVYNSFRNYQRF